jgi:hypothetical protein
VDFRSLRGVKDEPTDNITDFRIAPFRLFGEELGAGHSGIQRTKEPFVYPRIVFRDLGKIQLEFVAIEV